MGLPMTTVRLDSMLREFLPRRSLTTEAANVRDLLERMEEEYPKLRRRLRDETGTVRRFVRVFVNGEEISALHGLETPLGPSDHVDILHSIQGG